MAFFKGCLAELSWTLKLQKHVSRNSRPTVTKIIFTKARVWRTCVSAGGFTHEVSDIVEEELRGGLPLGDVHAAQQVVELRLALHPLPERQTQRVPELQRNKSCVLHSVCEPCRSHNSDGMSRKTSVPLDPSLSAPGPLPLSPWTPPSQPLDPSLSAPGPITLNL